MTPADVARRFEERFGRSPDGVWRAPGRVNLIGEHTDYNDGFVMPFAIDRHTVVAAALREDDIVDCASVALGDAPPVSIHDLHGPRGWWSYVHGSIDGIASRTAERRGLDVLVDSTVPVGAGLSSSAALECATAVAAAALLGVGIEPIDLAFVAQRAEQEFAGVPCGIMDQIASLFGRAGDVLFVDTRSLEIEPIPFPDALSVLVIDTRVSHALDEGAYAGRRRECEAAATALGVPALRDAVLGDLERLEDATMRRRAHHVVTEDARVVDAAEALRRGDAAEVGLLMTASHVSLRDDFEVSSPELDLAVGTALEAGALGARMTGAGFGGSAIALVEPDAVMVTTSAVRDAFEATGFVAPAVLEVRASAGAGRVA